MVGEIYEALLQSALEDQAQHYEGELSRLRAELAASEVMEEQMSADERSEIEALKSVISTLRKEADRLSKQNLETQAQEAGYRAAYERQLREQQVQKSVLDKIKSDAARECAEGELQLEELEQQVRDLTAYLRIQQEVSQNQELRNSRIFGTSNNQKRSGGKKNRRGIFRK